MRHHRRFDWVKFLFIGGLIVLIIAAIGIYAKSLSPYQQLRDQAEKIATNRADLKTVNDFWWYNRDKSYLTVAGQTKKNQSVYVVIQKKTGKVTILNQKSGITRQKAIQQVTQTSAPKKILNASLGKRGSEFVWDIGYLSKSGKLNYVTYSFRSGEQLNAIKNL
ncbi:DUF5590 domain-containing protein [Lacticaseibacillus rhamnosus]|uniref:cell wall elongation regulator TseB-like domain-containing protein n=1 Tax=Lacticaseibacillus rhamnosus TaxID=47715 RepID=UPI00065AD39A|nr:DUF5590 domain-containing protein [Lacticaseibacillus rhamnosus]KMO45554.1 hypothetical protein PY95_12795 [Lacticaseibacillus rhamnosus]OAT96824.1 hypothetical protein PY72_12795 [Lacticaseibacillus rhamnosus]